MSSLLPRLRPLRRQVRPVREVRLRCAALDPWETLDAFTRRDVKGELQPLLESASGREQLRKAVLSAMREEGSGTLLIGVCASNGRNARLGMESYCQALGVTSMASMSVDLRIPDATLLDDVALPCFLKLNPNQHLYASPLQSNHRGVLLQIGERQCGHLPLGLFGIPS